MEINGKWPDALDMADVQLRSVLAAGEVFAGTPIR